MRVKSCNAARRQDKKKLDHNSRQHESTLRLAPWVSSALHQRIQVLTAQGFVLHYSWTLGLVHALSCAHGDIPAWLRLARFSAGLRLSDQCAVADPAGLMDSNPLIATGGHACPYESGPDSHCSNIKCVTIELCNSSVYVDYLRYMCNSLNPARRSVYSNCYLFESGIRMFQHFECGVKWLQVSICA